MILQALTRLYEDLYQQNKIARPGWGRTKIHYALCLDGDGTLTQLVPLQKEVSVGKKTALRPQEFILPAPVKRSSGVAPNFLWDSAPYLLGLSDKENNQRSRACFGASQALHHQLLDGVESDTAQAILNFFDGWDVSSAKTHPVITAHLEELSGANLVFRVEGRFAQDDPEIRSAWDHHQSEKTGTKMQCLVTGKQDWIEPIHPSIKGVAGAQSSGAALVSFNAPSFCSYGKEQNFNAPVGSHAAFAYTTALNHLLADRNNVQRIGGNTTVVFWAEGADPAYAAFSCAALFGGELPQGLTDNDLRSAVKRLAEGKRTESLPLDPDRPFYLLGLAPNAARLSVRFFCRDTFGDLMRNVNDHQERLQIDGQRYAMMPLWALLQETIRSGEKSDNEKINPVMAGAVARAVFSGTRYPASLLESMMMRIRAERQITPGRAAILKAYYLKNENHQCPKEVLTVSLNENSTNVPYILGRLFSLYETVQEKANPGINATITDRYFNAASATPAMIFPILDNLYHKHQRKLEEGIRIYYDKQIGELKDRLGEAYPTRLSLPEQGSFDLGYYQQKQRRYAKKEA